MFVALFNGSGYALLTAASPGTATAAPNRQQLSVMYALTLMCEDAGGDMRSIHAKEGSVMHRQLHDGFRVIARCDSNGADEDVCDAVLAAVARAFTALSPCVPWGSPSMQRAAVPSEHKSIIDWLCRSVRAMLTPPGLLSLASAAPLVTTLSLKSTEFSVCKAFSAASVDSAVLQDDCVCALSAGGMHDIPEPDLLLIVFLACSFMPQHQVYLSPIPAPCTPDACCRITPLRCSSLFLTNTTSRRSAPPSPSPPSLTASKSSPCPQPPKAPMARCVSSCASRSRRSSKRLQAAATLSGACPLTLCRCATAAPPCVQPRAQ
jgi:hypothetical protein